MRFFEDAKRRIVGGFVVDGANTAKQQQARALRLDYRLEGFLTYRTERSEDNNRLVTDPPREADSTKFGQMD